ncbi:MAG: hypothetical protein ACRCZF_06770 [Gemmataceae bacterium]
MKHPLVLIYSPDDWLGKQLRPYCDQAGWVLRETRQTGACRAQLDEAPSQPTVLFLQVNPDDASAAAPVLDLLAGVHGAHGDVMCVVVCDGKISESERGHWMVGVLDLGAQFVIFPPLTRAVLEDLLGGLMSVPIRRMKPEFVPPARTDTIDLAEEGQEGLE